MKKLKIDNNNIWLSVAEGLFTFVFIVTTWVIFRAESVQASVGYIRGMLSSSLFGSPGDLPVKEIALAMLFLVIEFIQRGKLHPLKFEKSYSVWLTWSLYVSLVLIVLLFGGGSQKFIYFQF
jgi:hypothetical protein